MKVIVFDMTGVFTNDEEDGFFKGFEGLKESYTNLIKNAEVGDGTAAEVWDILVQTFNLDQEPESILTDLLSRKKIDKEVLDFITSLKKYKIVYLSNYYPEGAKYCRDRFKLDEIFDYGLFSCEIGARKPSAKGFEMIRDHFNVTYDDMFFVDDKEENVEAAKTLGIQGEVFDFEKLKVIL